MNTILSKIFISFIFTTSLILLYPNNSQANPGDTTWVMTYNEEYHNWATVHRDTFQLPGTEVSYNKIIMFYTIGCPSAGCDPWDRLGWVKVYNDADSTDYEIARVITPYNIVGGNYPGTCTWEIDVTDYAMLLQNDVSFGSYIESWIGDARGWLVTIEFAFIEGEPEYYPYKIVNLWQYSHAVFGNPEVPIEDKLIPMDVTIDANADKVKLKVITTGHGQGNTNNAAEFSQKWHSVKIGEDSVHHILWRADCSANPCSPQGGTWQYNRAGWCPGQSVIPWENDITTSIISGQTATLDYNIQPYENLCRPNNPDCVNGVTCPDCNYNYNGHTEPHYTIQSHLIYYSLDPPVNVGEAGNDILNKYILMQNFPNPFNPETKIVFNLKTDSKVNLAVFDILGQEVARLISDNLTAGVHQINFYASSLNSGVYFYRIDATGIDGNSFTSVRKMILTK